MLQHWTDGRQVRRAPGRPGLLRREISVHKGELRETIFVNINEDFEWVSEPHLAWNMMLFDHETKFLLKTPYQHTCTLNNFLSQPNKNRSQKKRSCSSSRSTTRPRSGFSWRARAGTAPTLWDHWSSCDTNRTRWWSCRKWAIPTFITKSGVDFSWKKEEKIILVNTQLFRLLLTWWNSFQHSALLENAHAVTLKHHPFIKHPNSQPHTTDPPSLIFYRPPEYEGTDVHVYIEPFCGAKREKVRWPLIFDFWSLIIHLYYLWNSPPIALDIVVRNFVNSLKCTVKHIFL